VTGRSGYSGGSAASGIRAGIREPGMMGGGSSDRGEGMTGPSGDELISEMSGPVAHSWNQLEVLVDHIAWYQLYSLPGKSN